MFKIALNLLTFKVNCCVYSGNENYNLNFQKKVFVPTCIFYDPHINNITVEKIFKLIRVLGELNGVPVVLLLETILGIHIYNLCCSQNYGN